MGGLGDGERPPQPAREPRRFGGGGSELFGGIADAVVGGGLFSFAFAVLRVSVALFSLHGKGIRLVGVDRDI